MDSTWAWRIPSIIQGLFSVVCILVLPFVPESPRWLEYQGRKEEARDVVAMACADGDLESPIVIAQYKQITDTIEYEKNVGETLSVKQLFKTRSARKRVLLAVSCAVFSTIAGSVLSSLCLNKLLICVAMWPLRTILDLCWIMLVSRTRQYSLRS